MKIAGGFGNQYMQSGYEDVGNWLSERMLYNILKKDTALQNSDTTLLQFFNDKSTESIGEISNYEDALIILNDSATLADSTLYASKLGIAAEKNNYSAGTSSKQIANFKSVNDIYLDQLENPGDTFTATQIQSLKDLAVKCPYSEGDAVYIARTLLTQIDNRWFYDDVEICENEVSGKKDNESETESSRNDKVKESEFVMVYPNPANTQLNLMFYANISGTAKFEIINGLGATVEIKQIQQQANNATFDVSNLPAGIYYWRLRDNERTISAGKVSIAR